MSSGLTRGLCRPSPASSRTPATPAQCHSFGRPVSEIGGEISVDFHADADFADFRTLPGHNRSSCSRFLRNAGSPAAPSLSRPVAVCPGASWRGQRGEAPRTRTTENDPPLAALTPTPWPALCRSSRARCDSRTFSALAPCADPFMPPCLWLRPKAAQIPSTPPTRGRCLQPASAARSNSPAERPR